MVYVTTNPYIDEPVAMRFTEDDDLGNMEYRLVDTPEIMSVSSDTSSREDPGCALASGTGRPELFWGDDKFNTRKTGQSPRRERSQDSQSSETGSLHSDSSGPAFLNHSYGANQSGGTWSTSFHGHTTRSSPSHHQQYPGNHVNGLVDRNPTQHLGDQRYPESRGLYPEHHLDNGLPEQRSTGASHDRTSPEGPRQGPRINLSKSFDQSLLIHAIRKQKALANYYELKENGMMNNNNNHKGDPYQGTPMARRQTSLNDSISERHVNAQEFSYVNSMYPSDTTRVSGTVVAGHVSPSAPEIPPRQNRPDHLSLLSRAQASPPSHPFYIPPKHHDRHDVHAPMGRSFDYKESESLPDDANARILAKSAFKTRALSADFGMTKVPDFPCHRAALGEAVPTTPTKVPLASPGDNLERSWPQGTHGSPGAELARRKSLTAMFSLHSISENKRGNSTKSPGQHHPEIQVPSVQPSLTTGTRAKTEPETSVRARLMRSTSAPNNLDHWTEDDEDDDDECYPSLGAGMDNDDYGFRNHPGFKHVQVTTDHEADSSASGTNEASTPVTGMQKSKSPATPRRILPKKWRKSKNLSNSAKHLSLWRPEGGCLWNCKNGRQLTLSRVSLMTLTEVERLALQKIAVTKLKALELGCAIHVPKDWNCSKRSKKSTFSSLRKRTASTSALENKSKDAKDTGWVFGVPLAKCVANDMELRRRKAPLIKERVESLDIPGHSVRQTRKSSTSSGGAVSSESPSESDLPRCVEDDYSAASQGSKLLDALSLSSTAQLQGQDTSPLAAHIPQIPYVVSTCCKHLETHGLRVLGIFRIGSSKKRAKQLREELDTGRDVRLGEEHNAHDVAALLKEYFRDLPDPLFTRDLYSAFVATRKIRNEDQRTSALQYLVSLLPGVNRDTLWALLRFLNTVVQHSTDVMTDTGQLLPGNKMDSTNLATLFGPNLLHKAKSGSEFQVESLERAEERKDVISVIKELIDKQSAIFQLSASVQDELYRLLQDTNPEALDHILRKRSLATHSRMETDPDTVTSGFYEDSECSSSVPHSPGYNSENDSGCPRTFTEAMHMGIVPHVVPPGTPHLGSPHHGIPHTPKGSRMAHPETQMFTSSPMLASPGLTHKPASRVSSDTAQWENRKSDMTLKVPACYRLSAPDQVGWYRGDRSISPASPRISPSPKAMKTGTPEMRIRITKTDSSEHASHGSGSMALSPPGHVRRSVGVPHGPGPGGPRTKSQHSRNTLTVPTTCARSKSSESCSSVGSSSGYRAGSSRSGTNSPLPPDQSSASSLSGKWYLDTPPDSPKEDDPSPLHRTSSTHRPLGFNVSKPSSSYSSASSSSTIRTNSPGGSFSAADTPANSSSHSMNSSRRPKSGVPPPSLRTDEAMDWQKERWKHWESLTRHHSEDFHEQETLV